MDAQKEKLVDAMASAMVSCGLVAKQVCSSAPIADFAVLALAENLKNISADLRDLVDAPEPALSRRAATYKLEMIRSGTIGYPGDVEFTEIVATSQGRG